MADDRQQMATENDIDMMQDDMADEEREDLQRLIDDGDGEDEDSEDAED